MMVVAMLQVVFELCDITSIKEKRQVVRSIKDRVRRKYQVSIAEIDVPDSLTFCHLGVAHVSNSRRLGESVMAKIEDFMESTIPGRLHDSSINIEVYN
ncbi:MAG: DUF503 domain-containing protein [Spirochaetales bacterium]|nr:DUF503 domain-containing protein [Spirochaetales bacterium]